jgi:hypothetical protein
MNTPLALRWLISERVMTVAAWDGTIPKKKNEITKERNNESERFTIEALENEQSIFVRLGTRDE